MKNIPTEDAISHAKRVYTGVTTNEQKIVADTYCGLLILSVVPEGTDKLIDAISTFQEMTKIMIRVEKYNEDFKKINKKVCGCIDNVCVSNDECCGKCHQHPGDL